MQTLVLFKLLFMPNWFGVWLIGDARVMKWIGYYSCNDLLSVLFLFIHLLMLPNLRICFNRFTEPFRPCNLSFKYDFIHSLTSIFVHRSEQLWNIVSIYWLFL